MRWWCEGSDDSKCCGRDQQRLSAFILAPAFTINALDFRPNIKPMPLFLDLPSNVPPSPCYSAKEEREHLRNVDGIIRMWYQLKLLPVASYKDDLVDRPTFDMNCNTSQQHDDDDPYLSILLLMMGWWFWCRNVDAQIGRTRVLDSKSHRRCLTACIWQIDVIIQSDGQLLTSIPQHDDPVLPLLSSALPLRKICVIGCRISIS